MHSSSSNYLGADRPRRYTGTLSKVTVFVVEALVLFLLIWGFFRLGAGKPDEEARLFRPVPDAAEHAYVAYAFAHGLSPLLPIANQLHLSRYAPVHPFLVSLWMRGDRGSLDAVFSWSPFALLAGVAVLYGLLIWAGIVMPVRLLAMYLILYSPLFFSISQNIMQEPSMFLLFATCLTAWCVGLHRWQRVSEAGAHSRLLLVMPLGSIFVAGVLCGALLCIRLTAFPLVLFLMLHGVWVVSWRRALTPSLLLLSGTVIPIIMVLLYNHHLAGFFHLAGYYLWMPGHRFFSWSNAFAAPINTATDTPHVLIILRDIAGISQRVMLCSWPSSLLLLTGGLFGFWWVGRRRQETSNTSGRFRLWFGLLFFLFLFGISQGVLLSLYYYDDFRFLVLTYPAIVLFGLTGWDRIIHVLYQTRTMGKFFTIALTSCVFMVIAGSYNISNAVEFFKEQRSRSQTAPTVEETQYTHRWYGSAVRQLRCPLFVDKLPVLNARLLLGLLESPYPLAPLAPETHLYFDGHTVQFLWYQVKPAVSYLDDRSLWQDTPIESYLFNPEDNQIAEGFISSLLEHYGKLAIYYPEWRTETLAPLVKHFDTCGYPLQVLGHLPGRRILLVRKDATVPVRGTP